MILQRPRPIAEPNAAPDFILDRPEKRRHLEDSAEDDDDQIEEDDLDEPIPWLQPRAREAPAADFLRSLQDLSVRMNSPSCKFKQMKKAVKDLTLGGSYITSYEVLQGWRETLSKATDLEKLKTFVDSLANFD